MPRNSRESLSSKFFHNMVQGINKEYIFQKRREKTKYINLINETKSNSVQIISYTIMDNHAHILLYSKDTYEMSKFMKNINEKYAMYYNFTNNRVGVVFRSRFKTQEILSEKQLYNCIKYIYNNPVKANIVNKIRDYKYSNYKQFKNEKILEKILENKQFNISNCKNSVSRDKEFFVDTDEDIRHYVESLIEKNLKSENLKNKILKDKANLKEVLFKIKNEVNVSYSTLADIIGISKTAIWKIMQNEDEKQKK